MHAAVARAVRIELEANFPYRAVLLFEHGHHVLLAEPMRHQAEQGVFRHHWRPLSGIGDDEAARTAQGRLGVTDEALIGIVTRAQPVGISVELREYRIELAQSHDR